MYDCCEPPGLCYCIEKQGLRKACSDGSYACSVDKILTILNFKQGVAMFSCEREGGRMFISNTLGTFEGIPRGRVDSCL